MIKMFNSKMSQFFYGILMVFLPVGHIFTRTYTQNAPLLGVRFQRLRATMFFCKRAISVATFLLITHITIYIQISLT